MFEKFEKIVMFFLYLTLFLVLLFLIGFFLFIILGCFLELITSISDGTFLTSFSDFFSLN